MLLIVGLWFLVFFLTCDRILFFLFLDGCSGCSDLRFSSLFIRIFFFLDLEELLVVVECDVSALFTFFAVYLPQFLHFRLLCLLSALEFFYYTV